MRRWAWRWFALVGTGLILVCLAVPPGIHWGAQWALELLVLAALVIGPRLHGPTDRRPWRLLTLALVLITCADVGIHVLRSLGLPQAVVEGLNLGFVVGYLLQGAATWVVVRARSAGGDRRDAFTDGAIVALGVALGLWQLLAPPDLVGLLGLTPGLTSTVIVASYPLIQAVITACNVLLLFSSAGRLASAWFLILAGFGVMGANTGYLLLLRGGEVEYGGPVDALWLVAYLLIGLAALHPSMRELTGPAGAGRARLPSVRLAMLAVVLLVIQSSLLASSDLRGQGAKVIVVSLLLTCVALWRMVGLVRQRERARAELRRTVDRQAAVARLGNEALAGADDEALLDQAFGVLADDFGAAWAAFLEPEPHGPGLRLRAGRGQVPPVDGLWPVPDEAELTATVHGPVVVVPVRGRADTFGILACLAPAGAALGDPELHFAMSVVNVLAGALERRRAEDEIRHQALHDPLTGLPNRVLLSDRLATALRRTGRSGLRVAVLFIDLDHFKQVNDTHGHRAGDQLLREVVARLRPLLRAEDTLARFAGDEFVAVMEIDGAARDARDVLASARRINDALARPFQLDVGQVSVSGSIGVALAGDQSTADSLLIDADSAMYRAKELGKNRTEVFG